MMRSILLASLLFLMPCEALSCDRISQPVSYEFTPRSVIFTGQVIDVEFFEVRRSVLEWANRHLDGITGFPENRGCRYGVRVVELFHGNPGRIVDLYTSLDWETGECLWGYEVGDTAFFNASVNDEGRIFLSWLEYFCGSDYGEEDFRAEAERRRYGWLE
tara:strand:- start:613 stop:1092 length:480 start_codon:yes stop_codon:yes gene_type:complete